MGLSLRQREIMSAARRDGAVFVEALAIEFAVSPQTIRRDLQDLCEAGLLARVHGGAVFESGTTHVSYEARRALARSAKAAIGAACARDIAERASVFLNIGTTPEAVARALAGRGPFLVVTNNLNVAGILADDPDCEVVVTGGMLRRPDGALVGEATAEAIRRFKVDVAVIGASALDEEGAILDFDLREAQGTQAALANARRRVLVADHSKFARTAPVRIAGIEALDAFYTDRPPPEGVVRLCREAGVELRIAESAAAETA